MIHYQSLSYFTYDIIFYTREMTVCVLFPIWFKNIGSLEFQLVHMLTKELMFYVRVSSFPVTEGDFLALKQSFAKQTHIAR